MEPAVTIALDAVMQIGSAEILAASDAPADQTIENISLFGLQRNNVQELQLGNVWNHG